MIFDGFGVEYDFMTLEQLRIFVAVAERRHMTRAAEALNITQSAASAAVAALEMRHGVALFDRVGRGLALSEAGRVFLPEARGVLARAESAVQALDDLTGLRRGRLRIAASQTAASYWLPPRMAAFARAYPLVTLTLKVGNTHHVADWLVEGLADLGFVEGAVDHTLLTHAPVGSDQLSLYAAPGHPLIRAAPVTPTDLASALWIMREPGSGTRSEFEVKLTALGLDPAALNVLLELPSNEAVLAAVASGGALTAVSDLAAAPHIAAGRLQRLAFEGVTRRFDSLAHRHRARSRASEAFLTLCEFG